MKSKQNNKSSKTSKRIIIKPKESEQFHYDVCKYGGKVLSDGIVDCLSSIEHLKDKVKIPDYAYAKAIELDCWSIGAKQVKYIDETGCEDFNRVEKDKNKLYLIGFTDFQVFTKVMSISFHDGYFYAYCSRGFYKLNKNKSANRYIDLINITNDSVFSFAPENLDEAWSNDDKYNDYMDKRLFELEKGIEEKTP